MEPCPSIDDILKTPKQFWTKLGSGAQGDVYKIKEYVLKIIPLYAKPSLRDAFQIEKSILEELAENPLISSYLPYLCSIEEKEVFGMHRGYILQKYEKTLNMREYIDDMKSKGKKLNFATGRRLISNLIEAILRLNIVGYIHRDIKPENILIRTTGEIDKPILIDFGLACEFPCEDVRMAGTVPYMPQNFLPRAARTIPNPYRVKTSILPYKSKKLYDKYAMMLTIEELLPVIDFESGINEAQVAEKQKFKDIIMNNIEKTKKAVMIDAASIKGSLLTNKYSSNANTRKKLENLNISIRNKLLKQNAGKRKRKTRKQ